jgi:hypothetical protein
MVDPWSYRERFFHAEVHRQRQQRFLLGDRRAQHLLAGSAGEKWILYVPEHRARLLRPNPRAAIGC